MDSSPLDAPSAKPPSAAMARIGQLLTIILALVGGGLGATLVEFGVLSFSQLPDQIPAPHVVPKSAGGTPLTLAMIGDILCERFDRPSAAWHSARIRLRQASIDAEKAKLKPGQVPSPDFLADLDDLSASYDLIGEPAKGVAVQEQKLAWMGGVEKAWIERQLALTAAGHSENPAAAVIPEMPGSILPLYRTYANLGTHLIHANFPAAMRGDSAARRRAAEGVTFLKLSVAINPDAHFGRETWQIIACEFFLASIDRPELLTTYDIAGNRWLEGPPPADAHPNLPQWPLDYARLDDPLAAVESLRKADAIDDESQSELRESIRLEIFPTGAEGDWKTELLTSLEGPVPFDEPTLGILGMWTLGGGASPHFALALAGICERIGESELAWRAYERASMLADRFSPNAALQAKLSAHCQERQSALLAGMHPEAADRAKAGETLRAAFQRDLQQALDRRAALQKFEEQELAAGKRPDDPGFYAAWNSSHPSIHTAPAHLDLVDSTGAMRRSTIDLVAGMLLLAGAGALLGQLIARYALRA